MAKAPHPVESYDAALIARATHFTAFQFRGRHDRRKEDNIPTLAEAEEKAREILRENSSRPVAIYAVDAGNNQAHVANIMP